MLFTTTLHYLSFIEITVVIHKCTQQNEPFEMYVMTFYKVQKALQSLQQYFSVVLLDG